MNTFLQLPTSKPEKFLTSTGSGRFYARLSQSEEVSASESRDSRTIWFLEAFDARWFDEYSEIPAHDTWIDYYERAQLFVLEAHPRIEHLKLISSVFGIRHAKYESGETNRWFLVETSESSNCPLGKDEIPARIYSNLYQSGIGAGIKQIQRAEPKTSARLRKAVSTAHIPDATEKQVDDALAGLKEIKWAVAYDVGQGNAIGLCHPRGSVECYFDFGGGVLANKDTFPAALKKFCFTGKAPIILSHWDSDHWSSARRDADSLKSTWIAPRQSVGPTHIALMADIMSNGGTLLLVPNDFPAKWRGQIYLERCRGSGRNYSGLALTLSKLPQGRGQLMLFPGDARYSCIPSFSAESKYVSVVAPHHGADMHNRIAPRCPSQPHSRLVYSYGAGNTFDHPRLVTRQDHHARGWRDPSIAPAAIAHEVRETARRGANGLGHVLLGWRTYRTPPLLPCGGAFCQLQAQQV